MFSEAVFANRAKRPTAVKKPVRGYEPHKIVKFEKLGVHTVRHLLMLFPRRHVDYGDPVPVAMLKFGQEQTVRVRVWQARERMMGPRMRSAEAQVGDSSGMMQCVWFNQPWVAKQLPVNAEIVLSGRVSEYQGRPKFDNPEWEPWSDELLHTGRLVPIYPLTQGLQNRTVRRVMQEALERGPDWVKGNLSEEKIERVRHFLGVEEQLAFRCRKDGFPAGVGTTVMELPHRNPIRLEAQKSGAKPSQALADSDKTRPEKSKATR